MYYFLIMDILQKYPSRHFSALEMYAEIKQDRECSLRSVQRMMLKITVSNPYVFREIKITPGVRHSSNLPCAVSEYVYYYKKF